MSHPMEGYYDGARRQSAWRWERIRKMQRRLAKTPLSEFTADYTLALCAVMDPAVIETRLNRNESKIDESLDKLDAFYKKRSKNRKKRVDPRYPTGKKPG